MEVTTPLQGLLSYSIIPLVISAIVIILIIVGHIILKRAKSIKLNKQPKQEHIQELQLVRPMNIESIKQAYLGTLTELDRAVSICGDTRGVYGSLSMTIRKFVSDVTGIDITVCSLTDIQRLNMVQLEKIISLCYDNEFKIKSGGNIRKDIEEAKEIIENWI